MNPRLERELAEMAKHINEEVITPELLADENRRCEAANWARSIADRILMRQPLDGDLPKFVEKCAALSRSKDSFPKTLDEARMMAEEAAQAPSLSSPIPGMDEITNGGYRAGWMVLTGAFTGSGKTTMAVRESVHHAKAGHPVLFVSCELGTPEIFSKIMAAGATEEGCPVLDLPIWIEDRIGEIEKLKACIIEWTEKVKASHPLSPVVILDYIQRVRVATQTNREREVAIVAEELQTLARANRILVMAAAQLNRQSQTEKPSLHHFRESGLIEQVADIALIVNRTDENAVSVLVAKNRWGPGSISLDVFVDWAKSAFTARAPGDVYKPLARELEKHLMSKEGMKETIRMLGRELWWNKRHPKKDDIYQAVKASKSLKIEGSSVVLLTENQGVTNG